MRILIAVTAILLMIGGCTSAIKYQPSLIDVNKAKNVLEELILTQHRKWKPSSFAIAKRYITWGYGSTTVNANSTKQTIVGGHRFYFHSIQKVVLVSWKSWYVVSLIDKNNRRNHILRTKNLDDAKLFVDAMTTLINVYGKN